MTELQLYGRNGLFHAILKASAIIHGRYAVLENGPADLNRGNLLADLDLPQGKYPLVACLPPVSAAEGQQELFTVRLLFLTTSVVTGDGQFKNRDPLTNTSLHRVQQDWNDMAAVAKGFVKVLGDLEKHATLRNKYFIDTREKIRTVRVSNTQKDKVSGVLVQFVVGLLGSCTQTDITVGDIDLDFPEHEQHYH